MSCQQISCQEHSLFMKAYKIEKGDWTENKNCLNLIDLTTLLIIVFASLIPSLFLRYFGTISLTFLGESRANYFITWAIFYSLYKFRLAVIILKKEIYQKNTTESCTKYKNRKSFKVLISSQIFNEIDSLLLPWKLTCDFSETGHWCIDNAIKLRVFSQVLKKFSIPGLIIT